MKLEELICNPKLAKELWDTGLRMSPTQFFYFEIKGGHQKGEIDYETYDDILFNDEEDFYAPTCQELGEILPFEITDDEMDHLFCFGFNHGKLQFWSNYITDPDETSHRLFKSDIEDKNESNLRAKIILELIEQKHCEIAPNGNLQIVE